MVNHNITITVVEVRGDRVRLGIEAPKEIPVHRSEVERAIQREGSKPAGAEPAAEPTEPPPVVAGVVTPAEAACDYAADDDAS